MVFLPITEEKTKKNNLCVRSLLVYFRLRLNVAKKESLRDKKIRSFFFLLLFRLSCITRLCVSNEHFLQMAKTFYFFFFCFFLFDDLLFFYSFVHIFPGEGGWWHVDTVSIQSKRGCNIKKLSQACVVIVVD